MLTMVKDNAVQLTMITSALFHFVINWEAVSDRGARSVSFITDKATTEGVFRSEARGACRQPLNQAPHTSLAALSLLLDHAHQDWPLPGRPSPQTGRRQKNPEGAKLCMPFPEGPVRSSKEKERRLERGWAQHTVQGRAYGSTRSRGPLRVFYTFWEVLASTKSGQEIRTINSFKKS